MNLGIDHLFRYEELVAALHDLEAAHPDLVALGEIGCSHEGRAIWLATVTDTSTGPHDHKPAVWIDANIHSVEITGSMAALHLLRTLTSRRDEPTVAHVLATRTFYVVPRVNPDGAELALSGDPTYLRSSVRDVGRASDRRGLRRRDVDGDGRILDMRFPDPNGAWKVSDADPRLMVPRGPDDLDGLWYRVVPEGVLDETHLGGPLVVPAADEPRRLDLNRQFPYAWATEDRQAGAGPTPISEPEARAVVDAVVARPNICVYVAHHTFSAAILRPFDDRPDSDFPGDDLRRYRDLCAKGTELTGYRAASVYHDFRYDLAEPIGGSADSWAYDHLGVFGFTTEFWSPLPHAGITGYHLTEWFEDHPVDDDLALLAWSDRELAGAAFVDWYPVEHPQLGPVELGGWDDLRFWQNPPDHLLEAEVAPHTDWEVWLALTTPLLAIRDVVTERRGDRTVVVHCVVENRGHFPTQVTEQAAVRRSVDPVVAELTVTDGAAIVGGEPRVMLGQLEGRERVRTTTSWAGRSHDHTTDRAVATWVIDAAPGTTIGVAVSHPRAGRDQRDVQV